MALDCTSRCGASEYVGDVANTNWREIEARLQAIEALAGLPAVYNNTTRPAANTVPVGRMIFNTDDGQHGGAPNWSTGAVWVDAAGNET